jgi:hypothetical protein
MKISACIASVALSAVLGSGISLAQPPAPTPAAGDKKAAAISKACSGQADAKKLHGKERRTFRAACKKSGDKRS